MENGGRQRPLETGSGLDGRLLTLPCILVDCQICIILTAILGLTNPPHEWIHLCTYQYTNMHARKCVLRTAISKDVGRTKCPQLVRLQTQTCAHTRLKQYIPNQTKHKQNLVRPTRHCRKRSGQATIAG